MDPAPPLSDLPAWALDLLREARVGRLGTAGADGQPLVVPVCYAFDGLRCYSAIDAKPKRTRRLRRLRHLEENPRVSLTVDHYEEDWTRLRWAIVEGTAAVLGPGRERTHALDLLRAKYRQYVDLGLEDAEGAVIAIAPVRVLHWRWA